jgi:type IV conjugative transfer system protein TraL
METLKTLDHIPRLLFWRIDDVFIMFAPMMLGVLFGNLVLILSGFIARWAYAKFRKRFAQMHFHGFLYWTLGYGLKRLPPSYARRFRR